MQKSKIQNTPDGKISIQAELEIPLGELAIYLLKPGEETTAIVNLLDTRQEYVDGEITRIVKNILSKKAKGVNLVSISLDYCDSGNVSHGAAIFSVVLEGTEYDLKIIAGDDKLFVFDWNEGIRSKIPAKDEKNH